MHVGTGPAHVGTGPAHVATAPYARGNRVPPPTHVGTGPAGAKAAAESPPPGSHPTSYSWRRGVRRASHP